MAGDGYNGVILSGNGEAIAIINNDGGPFFRSFLWPIDGNIGEMVA
ncbi:hypothetical protein L327_0122750 [Yersinia pestis S3]|nr:hypothetical protein L327_0122750 [Yersinia pestis S3]